MNTQFNKSQSGISRAQWLVIVAVVIVGAALAFLILTTRKQVDANPFDDDGPRPTATTTAAVPKEMNQVLMDEAQIKASDIHVANAGPLAISTILQFPGEIQINDDRTVHVVPRVSGVAEAVLVSTGQIVKKGQTLAVFSSQMISEQRSALQTAQKRLSLANTIYQREKTLWEQKITAEQDYLQALQSLREAEIAVDNAQQKLSALGVILNNNANSGSLNRFELHAPYDGLVVERNLSVGEAVKEDTPIFTISDLSTVWAEVHIPAKDLPHVRMGDKVTLRATAFDAQTTGTVAFIGALVGELTRMAKARIVLANPQGAWRPGLFVSVEVKAAEVRVPIAIETDALQTLGTQQVVFVRTETGFKAHPVKIGLNDGKRVEVLEGLAAGARYAAKGSYILKSELSKLTTEDGY
ncbi:MAG: efflux RND transporter periplasmic adaptor subunit [Burkholderiaceae bacterium]|nr:efflux RND transporter periplasmic adaptor subunit [Polynucleobacter sp.]MCF8187972.1 efflux RND transporter periplasmic adaptor subunit [Sulfuritalea sp.]